MARLDERVAQGEINRANERTAMIKTGADALTSAASLALGGGAAAAGARGFSRVMPFLSPYLTPEMAIKGINKVSPQLGSMLDAGLKKGLTLESGLDYLRDNLGQKEVKQEPAKQKGNIIQQYSPELFQYLENTIAKGVSPIQASVEARKAKKEFNEAISKMEKDHKVSFDEIVSGIFGQEPKGKGGSILKKLLAQPENPQEQQAAQMAAEQVMSGGRPQPNQLSQMSAQDSGDMRQQAMQPGQGQQKLMSAIQQLRQLRGA